MVRAAYAGHMAQAFMHLHSIFNLQLGLSILFFIIVFNLVLKRQNETVNGTSIYLLTLFAIFYKSNTEGTKFRINMLICFSFVKCACFALFSTSERLDSVKSPEKTLCG